MSDLLLANIIANKIVEEAEKTLGIRESGGENRGREVEEFQRTISPNTIGYAWCMSWAQTIAYRAAKRFGAPNPLYPSELCRKVFTECDPKYISKIPHWGFLCIWNNHCGIVTGSAKEGLFPTIEGNTNEKGSNEGDGVYRKLRSIRGGKIPQFHLLGFLDLPRMIMDSIPRNE